MCPWKITDTPSYHKYDSWDERPDWWPSTPKDEKENWVIQTGERWCRVKNDDGSWCCAPKFTSTTNLRTHFRKFHGIVADTSGGAINHERRNGLIQFYNKLNKVPIAETEPTLSSPVIVQPATTTQPVTSTTVNLPRESTKLSRKRKRRPVIPIRKGRVLKKDARINAGFPSGCDSCKPKQACPLINNPECKVNQYYTDASSSSESEDEEEEEV